MFAGTVVVIETIAHQTTTTIDLQKMVLRRVHVAWLGMGTLFAKRSSVICPDFLSLSLPDDAHSHHLTTGDSKVVMSSTNGTVVVLSEDHRGTNPKENTRIIENGGFVTNKGKQETHIC